MSTLLPPSQEIAAHYNEMMRGLAGEYIHKRWGDSEPKRRHYRQTELALKHALERVESPGEVLEIGCGPAVWTPLFLEKARRVRLFDISEEMLRAARVRLEEWQGGRHAGKVSYTCGDFVTTSLEEERFDTIVSVRAFEYMSDKERFVARCFELLRDGGTLVLATKNRGWRDLQRTAKSLEGVPRKDIRVNTAMQMDLKGWAEVMDTFRATGFRDVEAYPVVYGSYLRPFTSRPGLAFSDLLHQRYYRRPISTAFDSMVESYVVIGRKG